MPITIYPRYHLWWETKRSSSAYHSRKKKAFLLRIERLGKLKTLSRAWFSVEYLPQTYNESIVYTKDNLKQAIKDARVFTAAEEVRFIKNYWND